MEMPRPPKDSAPAVAEDAPAAEADAAKVAASNKTAASDRRDRNFFIEYLLKNFSDCNIENKNLSEKQDSLQNANYYI
jgi:hypothetical protein